MVEGKKEIRNRKVDKNKKKTKENKNIQENNDNESKQEQKIETTHSTSCFSTCCDCIRIILILLLFTIISWMTISFFVNTYLFLDAKPGSNGQFNQRTRDQKVALQVPLEDIYFGNDVTVRSNMIKVYFLTFFYF